MNNFSHHIILHLSLIAGVGPATIKLILEHVGFEDLEQIYMYRTEDFMNFGMGYDRAHKLMTGLQDRSLLEKELELIEKHQISWCVLGSFEYSQLLSQIEQPPAVIYYQGTNLFNNEKAIAFVGSRKADPYARVVVDKLIPELVKQDWVIVSGGAQGVDSFTHDAVVKAGGKTIVVLGSGLLHWYPISNTGLFNRVIQSGGMIVSCFPLQTQPVAANFPARNRIISGLSQGTVVVQAAAKSGALITADFAVEQGRQVFAVPGSIEYGLHDGCHYLIQQGAKLVTCVYDIVIELGLGQTFILNEQNQLTLLSASDSQNTLPNMHEHINAEDKLILDLLLRPKSIDDLLLSTHLPLEDLMQKLFDLSLQGKVAQDMMGLWQRL